MFDGQNPFDQPAENDLRTYNKFEKLLQVKGTITQMVVCWTRITSKIIIR